MCLLSAWIHFSPLFLLSVNYVLGLSYFADEDHFSQTPEDFPWVWCVACSKLFPGGLLPGWVQSTALSGVFLSPPQLTLQSTKSRVAFFEELWTAGLQRREPTADFTFLICRERQCSRRFLVLCQGIGVKGKQSAALLCTSSMFTCLHRCMSRASALTCEFLMHLFTIRVLGRVLKSACLGFCRVQNRF